MQLLHKLVFIMNHNENIAYIVLYSQYFSYLFQDSNDPGIADHVWQDKCAAIAAAMRPLSITSEMDCGMDSCPAQWMAG